MNSGGGTRHYFFIFKTTKMNTNSNNKGTSNRMNASTECGNCWGYQEWNHTIYPKTRQPNTTEDGFILRFVKQHLA